MGLTGCWREGITPPPGHAGANWHSTASGGAEWAVAEAGGLVGQQAVPATWPLSLAWLSPAFAGSRTVFLHAAGANPHVHMLLGS